MRLVKIIWFQVAQAAYFFYYVGERQQFHSFIFMRYLTQFLSCFISLLIHGILSIYLRLGFLAFLYQK